MAESGYEADVVRWSEQQAGLLRRAAGGEQVPGLDWPNLIEEIAAVGRSEMHAVESLLEQSLVRLLKMAAWPETKAAARWNAEALAALSDARRRCTPALRERLDLAGLFAAAVRQVRRTRQKGAAPSRLPPRCPLALDDLLAEDPDPTALAFRLSAAAKE